MEFPRESMSHCLKGDCFDLCGFRGQDEGVSVCNGLGDAVREFQSMKLLMGLFNRGFSRLVFIVKLDCLVTVILSGFSAVRISHSNPLLAFTYLIVLLDAGVANISIFQLAFKVTAGLEDLRRAIKVKSIKIKLFANYRFDATFERLKICKITNGGRPDFGFCYQQPQQGAWP